MHRVEILTFPDGQLLDVAGPLQAFASCNGLLGEQGRPPAYTITALAAGGGQVTMSSGLGLALAPLPPAGSPCDTLIVAGGRGVDAAIADTDLLLWLTARCRATPRVASVCTGAFLLAATGILDGRRAATHWAWCARLADRHPRVRVDPDPIFLVDGNVWTSAGVTAGIDMALAMIEADLGRDLALAVARRLVMFLKRPGGQAQFSTTLALQRSGRFDELHAWIRANLARDLRLPALARQAGMSERSLLRRYRQAVGATPARTVERLRVEAACRQLGDTGRGVKEVARACGFGSEETMRRSFLRQLEVTPQAWRERFAAPLRSG